MMFLLGLISFLLLFCATISGFLLFTGAFFLWFFFLAVMGSFLLLTSAVVFLGLHWILFLLSCGIFVIFLWFVYFFRDHTDPKSRELLRKFLIFFAIFSAVLCVISCAFVFSSSHSEKIVTHEYVYLPTQSRDVVFL
ncbi:hypothetical protein [Candidatus Ichthyocystis hellenicum]|nr:hypothetical protein [Candidatus Ichthyocystis hellenicum]